LGNDAISWAWLFVARHLTSEGIAILSAKLGVCDDWAELLALTTAARNRARTVVLVLGRVVVIVRPFGKNAVDWAGLSIAWHITLKSRGSLTAEGSWGQNLAVLRTNTAAASHGALAVHVVILIGWNIITPLGNNGIDWARLVVAKNRRGEKRASLAAVSGSLDDLARQDASTTATRLRARGVEGEIVVVGAWDVWLETVGSGNRPLGHYTVIGAGARVARDSLG